MGISEPLRHSLTKARFCRTRKVSVRKVAKVYLLPSETEETESLEGGRTTVRVNTFERDAFRSSARRALFAALNSAESTAKSAWRSSMSTT